MTFDARAAQRLAEVAKTMLGEVAKLETEIILDQVKYAANSGRRNLVFFKEPKNKDLISARLRSLGFSIKEFNGRDVGDYSYTIGW